MIRPTMLRSVRRRLAVTFAGCLCLSMALPLIAAPEETPKRQHRAVEPEAKRVTDGLLHLVNKGSEAALRSAPGLTPEIIERVLAHREKGVPYATLREFEKDTGISDAQLSQALQPFMDSATTSSAVAQRPPVPDARLQKMQQNADPEDKAPASPEASSPGEEEPLVTVRPGFYGDLPGYENLDQLDEVVRTEFLETVNREKCSCGCENETLAFCLVNDPGCPVVKSRVRKIYDDLLSRASTEK